MVWVFPHSAIEMEIYGESPFKVNGQRLMYYMGNSKGVSVIFEMGLGEV